MKCKEAKLLIIEAWDSWLRKQAFDFARPTGRDFDRILTVLRHTNGNPCSAAKVAKRWKTRFS
jgi:hypothetical protein